MRLKFFLLSSSKKSPRRFDPFQTLASPPPSGRRLFSSIFSSSRLFHLGFETSHRHCPLRYFSLSSESSPSFLSQVEKQGRLIPVKAYFLSTSINLKGLLTQNAFNIISPASRASNYVILRFFDNDFNFENDPQVVEFDFSNESNCEHMVVFQYGSVVLFNVPEHKADRYLKTVEKHVSSLLPEITKDVTEMIRKWSHDLFATLTSDTAATAMTNHALPDFTYGHVTHHHHTTQVSYHCQTQVRTYVAKQPDTTKQKYAVVEKPTLKTMMQGGLDHIMLKTLNIDGIRTIGSVLGQSIALDYYVRQVDGMVEQLRDINSEMEKTGTYSLKNKVPLQLLGKANSNLEAVILKLKLFDRPEIAWKNANYAQIWEYLQDDYELARRFGSLDFKLKFVKRNMLFFQKILQDRKVEYLDWLIVLLLVLETLILLLPQRIQEVERSKLGIEEVREENSLKFED